MNDLTPRRQGEKTGELKPRLFTKLLRRLFPVRPWNPLTPGPSPPTGRGGREFEFTTLAPLGERLLTTEN
jgi:hypothetical protein